MIQAIIFDWGWVLIDNPANSLMEYCAKSLWVDCQALKICFWEYEDAFQRGTIAENVMWAWICSKLGWQASNSPSLWKEAVESVFHDKPEIHALFPLLRRDWYKLWFLSNTEIPTVQYFFEKNYHENFDVCVFSCTEHEVKPEPRIYEIIIERLGIIPEEAVFIDDKPPFIEGAKSVGLQGIVFKSPKQVIEDLRALGVKGI